MVFLEREYTKCDVFCHRKRVPREKNRLPRGVVADCKNHVGIRRAHFFYRGTVRNVRNLRLSADNLQPANNLLPLRDDLLGVGIELADKFADSFSARYWTIRLDDFAIRILGHADFLEFANDTAAISFYLEAESGVLSR